MIGFSAPTGRAEGDVTRRAGRGGDAPGRAVAAAYADAAISVVREQTEFVHPGDCRSARGDAELPVDRNCLRLHGVSCDVETLADLAQGEVGGQQRQESQLGRGE